MLSRYFGADDIDAGPAVPTVRRMDLQEDVNQWGQWSSGGVAQVRVAQATPDPAPAFDQTMPARMAAPPPAARKGPTREQRREAALAVVDQHHHRVANTIRTMWGHKECSLYINKMLMAGGDGFGQNRVGFNPEAVEAMLSLVDLHDAEYP